MLFRSGGSEMKMIETSLVCVFLLFLRIVKCDGQLLKPSLTNSLNNGEELIYELFKISNINANSETIHSVKPSYLINLEHCSFLKGYIKYLL